MPEIRSLQGLRGLAIALVVLFHIGTVLGGWVGVQMFFVLSGFLITSILVRSKHEPLGYYLKRFYYRRALRIFPLYIVFVALFALKFAVAGANDAWSQQWPYLATYTLNFARMKQDYVPPRYWGHMWSLAVEEQFYFVWPMVVYMLSAKAFRRALIGIFIGGPVLRAAVYLYLREDNTDLMWIGQVINNLTLSHFDAFAAGAWVATNPLPTRGKDTLKPLLASTAVVLIAGAINYAVTPSTPWLIPSTLGYPINMAFNAQSVWGFTLLNVWFACFLRTLLVPGPLTRVMEWRPLVYLGTISYGVYVIHQPVLVLMHERLGWNVELWNARNVGFLFAYLAIVIVMAHVSFTQFEQRFLALKDKLRRPAV